MKFLLTVALLALPFCALTAQAQAPDAPTAASVALPDAFQDYLATLAEMNSVLIGVTDKASADEAVTALADLELRIATHKALMAEIMDDLTEAQQEAFTMSILTHLTSMTEQAERLQEEDFYGCAALAELLLGEVDDDDIE